MANKGMRIQKTHSDGSATVTRSDGKLIRLTAGQVRKWITRTK